MYPDPHFLSERACSQDQEVSFSSTINAYYSSLSPFPFSPSIFDHNLLFNEYTFQATNLDGPALLIPDPAADTGTTVAKKTPCRKRFRTDRHSKICTSQGLRDRRMRLSLGVARQFFSLQDMLGFDKASHTLDWLLKQSKSAIDRLTGFSSLNHEVPNTSIFVNELFASECEGISIITEHNNKSKPSGASAGSLKEKKCCPRPREVAFAPRVTKESREKARARARERTIEKKRIQCEISFSDTSKLDQLVPSEATGLDTSSKHIDGEYECSLATMMPSRLMYMQQQ